MKIKRLNLRSMSEQLSDNELKQVLGGYSGRIIWCCPKSSLYEGCYMHNCSSDSDCDPGYYCDK